MPKTKSRRPEPRKKTKSLTEFAKKIKPLKTPDLPPQIQKTKGKVTDLGMMQFLFNLFLLNEKLPRHNKMTNEEIKRQLYREFPEYMATRKDILEEKTRKAGGRRPPDPNSINYYRYLFNIGKLVKNSTPPLCSFRYNIEGEKVSSRSADKVIDAVDVKSYLTRYGFDREGTPPVKPYVPKRVNA